MHIRYEPCASLSGKSQLLLSSSVEIAGVKPVFLNNLDIDSNGIIYLTDTCKQWQINEFFYSVMEGSGTGRCVSFSSPAYTSLTFKIPPKCRSTCIITALKTKKGILNAKSRLIQSCFFI